MNVTDKKQEADLSPEVDELEPQVRSLASSGKLTDALEKIATLEKRSRNAADLSSTTRLLLLSVLLIRSKPDLKSTNWQLLSETLSSLSRKHGQLKQAVTKMVQLSMYFLHPPGSSLVPSEEGPEDEEGDVEMKDVAADGIHGEKPGSSSQAKEASGQTKKGDRKPGQEKALEDKGEGAEDPKITKLIDEAKTIGDQGVTEDQRHKLIETLRTVSEGKIFVEVERARVTRLLASILAAKGDVSGAADVLQELAVETFGSMGRREKTDFILEQMRLNLERGDYARTNIVSRKVNTKFFDERRQQDLKLKFYELMIKYALHERKHLDVARYENAIFDTPRIKVDEQKARQALQNVVVFLILSPYDNEQSDMMARIEQLEALDKAPEHKWPGIQELYGPLLRSTPTFAVGADGDYRWEELHKRVVEHNIRVVSKYYTKITLARLATLLDLSVEEAEKSLAALVTSATVWAKIDRPAGVVNFERRKETSEHLNAWSNDMGQLLGLVEKTCHLISREHAISKAGLVAAQQ
ncbi:26S proteasome regulatory complex, subunit RPN5/PSMD12 [Ceraceosorus bombacis]|uniref:26S proteasome regulatory complex, subunit RPN5/PSMD12 n=1 Tax=Ceraceosorus bombacis TaxID=401625 RepID=A0A0P1BML4_9BASI|nr:26S proteasome regulatory complex, subunit RPN5/PSMD12 [Ceraceosorus bombacis]